MPKHVISVSSDEESPVLATPLPLTSQRVTRRSRGEALVVPAKKRRLSTSAGEATEVSRQARGPSKRVVVRKAQKVPDAETLLVKYAPRAFADLVTSSQRNKDVTKWVADNNKPAPRSKVLFLYGSPGSGKLSLIQTIAEAQNLSVRVWNKDEILNSEAYVSELHLFKRALLYERTRSRSVVGEECGAVSKLLVFKAMPHCANAAQREELQKVLSEFAAELTTPRPDGAQEYPVVFIFSTHCSHSVKFLLHTQFPDDFLASTRIHQIFIHRVTAAAMKKRLTSIAKSEFVDKAASVVQRVMAHTEGDIRQAIHCLAFEMIRPDPFAEHAKARSAFFQKKWSHSMTDEDTAHVVPVDASVCDTAASHERMEVGHGTARILAAKRDGDGVTLNHSVLETLTMVGCGAEKLVGYVHHSLPRYCQIEDGIDKMAAVCRDMSDANVYSATLNEAYMHSGWPSQCLFSWSTNKHQLPPAPSRSKCMEPCHPPPHGINATQSSQVMQRIMNDALPREEVSHYTRTTLALDTMPMLHQILFKRKRSNYVPKVSPCIAASQFGNQGGSTVSGVGIGGGGGGAIATSQGSCGGGGGLSQGSMPSPARKVKPVPFLQRVQAKPVPFRPSLVSNRPTPFLQMRPTLVRPEPAQRLVFTLRQVKCLRELCHYLTGVWLPHQADGEWRSFAGRWEKPKANLFQVVEDLRDRSLLVETLPADELALHSKENEDDPIED